ncbi:MAG: ferrochelatase, partial [Vicinamibacterales bacterium]
LTDLTLAQAAALRAVRGPKIPVAVGMRNWHPFIKDALSELADSGVSRVVAIPLAPQFSTLSVTKYFDAATAGLPDGMTLVRVASFHCHPLLIGAFASRVRDAAPQPGEEVIFSAHSLPARVIKSGDPYANEFARTARAVAAREGLRRYRRAYQSAGRTPEPWIGLDIADLIAHRADHGARRFLVVPVGFVCDHTEILFDIDTQAKAAADARGVALRRTESLNTMPQFIALLADLVRTAAHD